MADPNDALLAEVDQALAALDQKDDHFTVDIGGHVLQPFGGTRTGTGLVPSQQAFDVVCASKPAKLTIYEYEDPSHNVEALYNPTEFESSIDSDWNRYLAPGASYAHLHFIGTRNKTMEFELYWWVTGESSVAISDAALTWLDTWVHPARTQDGWSLGPELLVLEWPSRQPMYCYLIECKVRHLKFAITGETVNWAATLKFEEATSSAPGSRSVDSVTAVKGFSAPALDPKLAKKVGKGRRIKAPERNKRQEKAR